MKKKRILREILNIFLVIVGSAVLAFGDAAFITPLNLVTGGVISVGVIVQYFVGDAFQVVDLITWGMQLILLVVSFIFLGKKFTMHTILATILYPAFFTLFYRIPVGGHASIGMAIAEQFIAGGETYALKLLAGFFGGALVGAGVAICYFGDGSTGGFDVISVLLARHTPIKESISAFVIDALLVIIGMICMKDVPAGLIGILSALSCALAVQYMYVYQNSYVIADVISSKSEDIENYIIDTMDRTSTIFIAKGSYTEEEKIVLRVAMTRREQFEFKNFIAEIDPRAFVTFVSASMVNGEGFDPLLSPMQIAQKRKEARELKQQQKAENTLENMEKTEENPEE